jgi:hypothetical protein
VTSGKKNLIFGQFLNLLNKFTATLGISTEKQRMDITMFMSHIKKSNHLALAFDIFCQAVNTIPKDLLSEGLKQVLEPKFKTETLYKTKTSEAENRLGLMLNLCQETCNIIKTIPELKRSATLRIATRFIAEQNETYAV